MSNNPLREIIEKGLDHTVSKWHHYLPLYHKHFEVYKKKASPTNKIVIIEIGVQKGGSLDMWNEYFGKDNCLIFGIDIDPECRKLTHDNIFIVIGDQEKVPFLLEVQKQLPPPDILIDDGSHFIKQQINTFDILFPHVKPGGIFLCQDVHTSYMEYFGGGLGNQYTFINHTKLVIDYMHAYHHPPNANTINHLTKTCAGIHVYDSMIFFEKAEKEITKPITQNWQGRLDIKPIVNSSTSSKSRSEEEKNLYLDLLKKTVSDYIYVSNIAGQGMKANDQQIENGLIWPDRAHSMIGLKRLDNIQYCVEDILKNNIEGDLIETGVWRGGAVIFMKGILKCYGDNKRKIFAADSFEGLPPPDPKYPADKGDSHHTISFLAVPQEEVEANFRRYGLLDNNIVFVKGFFEHSIPKAPIDKLAILRLDGDMYSSTIQVLELLYDKVSIGGYIIIDDYKLPGCRKAVDDFRLQRNIKENLLAIDEFSRYWKKLY